MSGILRGKRRFVILWFNNISMICLSKSVSEWTLFFFEEGINVKILNLQLQWGSVEFSVYRTRDSKWFCKKAEKQHIIVRHKALLETTVSCDNMTKNTIVTITYTWNNILSDCTFRYLFSTLNIWFLKFCFWHECSD